MWNYSFHERNVMEGQSQQQLSNVRSIETPLHEEAKAFESGKSPMADGIAAQCGGVGGRLMGEGQEHAPGPEPVLRMR
jgi:hypothetical protein